MSARSPAYTCPRCAAQYQPHSRYCGRCGADLSDIGSDDTQLAVSGGHDAVAATLGSGYLNRRASDHERDMWLGVVVDSRYRVIEVIGRGGMGVVYKVEHQRMSKIAAMKVLRHALDGDAAQVERFRREADAVSRLTHPNTVQVFDFGTAQGALYLIMEYVRGLNLAMLAQRDGPLPFARAAPLFMQICAALAEAHDLGVVHRDLKPENVLVTRTHRGRDFVKVLDFGLAKLSEGEEVPATTEREAILGTPYYMSPEQIRGEEVDARADIYSLGALMYRVLTGQHAFVAQTPVGIVTQHLTAELVAPSARAEGLNIPAVVDDIVVRAMAKERDQRFATVGEMLDALEQAYIDTCDATARSAAGLSWTSSSAPPSRGALDDDEVDYGMLSSVRLQRGDLDEFERALRRRFWLRVTLVPVVLAGLACAAVYWLLWRADGPRTRESEPNNTIEQATLIRPGAAVTGLVGKRVDKSTPDRDFYRVRGRGEDEVRVATVHVTELPNIDIELSLFDRTGKLLGRADEGGIDQGEWIRRLKVRTPVYVQVTESMPVPRLPTENVSDTYTLTVTLEPPDEGGEIEPNDSISDAMPLRPGAAVTGFLDSRGDVDSYRFDGEAGRYQLSVDGAAEVPLVWRIEDRPRSDNRQQTVELAPGQVIQLERTDRDRPHGHALPGANEAYAIRVLPVAANADDKNSQ